MRPRLFSKPLGKLTVSGLLAFGLLLGAAGSASAQSNVNSVFFAHFAWGNQSNGFWTTTDNYTNPNATGTANLSAMLQLFAQDGTQNLPACEVDFTNGTTLHLSPCNNIPITLSSNQFSSLGLTIKGEPGVQVQQGQGWSKITFNAPVISSRQFVFTSNGSNPCCPQNNPYTEVAVLPSGPAQAFAANVVPNSGIALANPGLLGVAGAITIQGSVFDTGGNLVAQNLSISLGLNQQTAKLLGGAGGFFPNLPSTFKVGYVLFKSTLPFIATGFNFESNNSVGVDIPAAAGPNVANRYDGTFNQTSSGGPTGTFSLLIGPEGKGRFSCLLTSTPTGGATSTVACAGSTNVNHSGHVTFQTVQTDPNAMGGASFNGGFSADGTTMLGVIMSGPGGGFSFLGTFMGSAVGPITF